MTSKSTIKTIGKVLDKIKERFDLLGSLRVIFKKEEMMSMFNVDTQEFNGILKILTRKKVIEWHEFDRTNVDSANSCSIYLPRDFTRKYIEFSRVVTLASGETKTHSKSVGGSQKSLKTAKEVEIRFPYKIPAGTKWENITIKFEDEENVFIKVKQFEHHANYKDMGFVGNGNSPKPSVLWLFLKVLSRASITGEIVIKDPEAKAVYKKQKELLAKGLQDYFSIDYDPFYPYRSSSEKDGNSYKIKITLVPPPEIEKEVEEEIEEDDKFGVKEYLADSFK